MNMCDSIMKYKARLLFIGIAISFIIGCLSKVDSITSEDLDTSVGPIIETLYDSEGIILSESSSDTHVGDALRRFSQTKRISSSSSLRYGLVFAKRKHSLYTSTQHFDSFKRFPSSLMKARRYLISLRRLII
jgi:hypothetical protein